MCAGNPHYTPEVSTKVMIVNFAVKQQGLEAQLLNTVVKQERADLDRQKNELVLKVAQGKRTQVRNSTKPKAMLTNILIRLSSMVILLHPCCLTLHVTNLQPRLSNAEPAAGTVDVRPILGIVSRADTLGIMSNCCRLTVILWADAQRLCLTMLRLHG